MIIKLLADIVLKRFIIQLICYIRVLWNNKEKVVEGEFWACTRCKTEIANRRHETRVSWETETENCSEASVPRRAVWRPYRQLPEKKSDQIKACVGSNCQAAIRRTEEKGEEEEKEEEQTMPQEKQGVADWEKAPRKLMPRWPQYEPTKYILVAPCVALEIRRSAPIHDEDWQTSS